MDHSNCEGWEVTTFGCGCGKKAVGGTPLTTSRRVTVYEVQVNGLAVDEYENLPAARAKAVEVNGRVKVSSKVVTG